MLEYLRVRRRIDYHLIGPLPYFLTGFFLILILLPTTMMILSFTDGFVEAFGIEVIIGDIIFMSIGFIGLVVGIALIIGKLQFNREVASRSRAYEASRTLEEAFFEPITEISIEPYENKHDSEKVGIDELSNIASKEAIDWNKIYPLIYQEKEVDQICPICKLSIERKEFIMQCPKCLKLFHGKHLVEWLLENETCPICQTKIDIR